MNFNEQPGSPEKQEMTPERLKQIIEKIEDNSFKTSEGLKRPLRRKLYANAALRELLLESDQDNGEIKIMNVVFTIVNGRRNPEDKMVSIIHHADQGLIINFLLKKYKITEEEMGIEKTPIVEMETGKFGIKSGDKSPKKDTIYATKTLRKMLGIEGDGGEIEIDDGAYKVNTARKLPGQQNFSNFVHEESKESVLRFLDEKLTESIEN